MRVRIEVNLYIPLSIVLLKSWLVKTMHFIAVRSKQHVYLLCRRRFWLINDFVTKQTVWNPDCWVNFDFPRIT